jgi:hypothetical protein
MYQVSEEYLSRIYEEKQALKIYINGTKIEDRYIYGCKPSGNVFTNEEFALGSTPSIGIELKLDNRAIPSTINSIYIESGLEDELVPIGYFNVDDISEDDDITTFSLLDNMVKFDENYNGKELIDEKGYATLLEVWLDICNKFGVEAGTTSFNGQDIQIAVYDSSLSARTYIGYIAEQAGGFAIIGRDGKLYIRKIGESVIEYSKKYLKSGFKFSNSLKITRVKYEDGIQDFVSGYDTENTLYISQDNMYITSQEQIDNIYDYYNELELYGFSGSGKIDPAIDIGDILVIDGKQIVYQGTMEYSGKFIASISSDIQSKAQEESTSRQVSQTTINRRVESSINQAEERIKTLISEIYEEDGIVNEKYTQILQEIDNIVNSVQSSGGNNLIKNSVMFAYDDNGVPSDWDLSEDGSLTINSSTESLLNGCTSGHVFTLSNKTVSQQITVKVDDSSIAENDKTYYSFSTKIKKNAVGTCYVKIYNTSEEYLIEIPEGESAFYKEYTIKSLLPKEGYYIIEFYGSEESSATFTDNTFTVGSYVSQWTQANGEIMNTQVNINVDGVLVKSSIYEGDYTVMSPLEFAGYSNINGTITKVFTINKDTTKVTKLEAEKEIKMPPIKIVPVTEGEIQGWAFVPISD